VKLQYYKKNYKIDYKNHSIYTHHYSFDTMSMYNNNKHDDKILKINKHVQLILLQYNENKLELEKVN